MLGIVLSVGKTLMFGRGVWPVAADVEAGDVAVNGGGTERFG